MTSLLTALVLAAPHPTLQVYFQSTLASPAVQQQVFQKVAKTFAPPAATPKVGKKTVVQAIIARDGKLVTTTIGLESGSKAWDAAALAAVKRAAPFAPLPASFSADTVEVHFHFAWEG